MKCCVCEVELSGGLDTYGAIGLEMCWNCFITTDSTCAKFTEEFKDLFKMKEEIKSELEDIEDEIDELRKRAYRKNDEFKKVQASIEKANQKIKDLSSNPIYSR